MPSTGTVLNVVATVTDILLPPAIYEGYSQFQFVSALTLASVETVRITDSLFRGIGPASTAGAAGQAYGALAFQLGGASQVSPLSLVILNSVFDGVSSGISSGAVTVPAAPFAGIQGISIIGSTFTNNDVQGFGAAVYIGGCGSGGGGPAYAPVSFVDSTFTSNSAPYGGGGALGLGPNCFYTIDRCAFSGNSAGQYGGAVSLFNGGSANSTLSVAASTFTANNVGDLLGPEGCSSVQGGCCGGAMAIGDATAMTVTGSTFQANLNTGPNNGGASAWVLHMTRGA